jgi:hypothetical protein
LGFVEVLVPRRTAVDLLLQKIGQRELLFHAWPQVAEVFLDELFQTQSFIQLADQNKPPSEVARDPWKSTFNEALNKSRNG